MKAVRAIRDASKIAITFDGNSLADAAYSTLCTQIEALRPISGGLTIHNKAISGQTVANMIATASDVDSSWEAGKLNVLIVWEITNSVFNTGKTGLEACAELVTYIAARKAIHPWRVVLMTCIPRGSLFTYWTATTGEAQMQAANAYLRTNYRAMGADALVEMRQGPFDFTDATNMDNFPAELWVNPTHPNSAGHAYTARYVADVLVNLRAR